MASWQQTHIYPYCIVAEKQRPRNRNGTQERKENSNTPVGMEELALWISSPHWGLDMVFCGGILWERKVLGCQELGGQNLPKMVVAEKEEA